MTQDKKDFLIELKALMEKHNVLSIDFGASGGSDWHGIHDEHMYICFRGNETMRVSDGTWFSPNCIDEVLTTIDNGVNSANN